MLKRFRRRATKPAIEFCDRCASVCDSACRSDAVRDRALDRALGLGARWA